MKSSRNHAGTSESLQGPTCRHATALRPVVHAPPVKNTDRRRTACVVLAFSAFALPEAAHPLFADAPSRARSSGTPATRVASEGKPILGYVNEIPPETPADREARHRRIAERRKGTPLMVHRGAGQLAPENTLEAYAAAMDHGADGIEIDIRRSTDEVLYMLHDDTLDRMTSCTGKAKTRTYYELLQCRLRGGDERTRIPTLAAVLMLVRQRAALLHLDIKEPGLEDDIVRLFDAADVWDHVVEVNRYNSDKLLRERRPALLTYKGWFPEGKGAKDPAGVRHVLESKGDMVFCKNPRDAARAMKKPVSSPVPLPSNLRVLWLPGGPVTTRPAMPAPER